MTETPIDLPDLSAIVCVGGPIRKIYAASRMWHFEMHHYCGPMPIHKRTGNGIDAPKAFWEAVTLWAQQGERIDAAGICVYERSTPKPLYHLGGRNYTEDPAMAARFGVVTPVSEKRKQVTDEARLNFLVAEVERLTVENRELRDDFRRRFIDMKLRAEQAETDLKHAEAALAQMRKKEDLSRVDSQ